MNKIPKKNYLMLAVISVLTIMLVLYINGWIKTYKINKLEIGPLENNVNQVNKNELYMSLSESNQIILYIGYNHVEEIKKFEKSLLKIIKNKNLVEYIWYYNVTDEMDNDDYLKTLRNEFPELKNDINKAPMLIYVKNGVGIEVIDSNNNLITTDDVNTLINKYGVGQ